MADSIKDLIISVADKTQNAALNHSVFGEPIVLDGVTVVPVYKVSFGFGGGGFSTPKKLDESGLAGGAGAGVSVNPVAYLTVQNGRVKITAATEEKNGFSLEDVASLFSKIKPKKKK